MRTSSIAAGFARALLELAVKKGADRAALLERANIRAADLEDQDNRIAFANYQTLMRAGKELSNEPALALHFGEAQRMAELSVVGLLQQSCETYAEAFEQLGRYTQLIIDVPVEDRSGRRLVLKQEDGKLWLLDTRKDPNAFPELTESGFARMAGSAGRRGIDALIKEIHVTHAEPDYRAEYDRIFGRPVVFESDRNALLMADASFLDMRFPNPSRYALGLLCARADALLKSLESSTTVRGRVESLLIPMLQKGEPTADAVAKRLAIGRKTLYRSLRAEGTSFENVLLELRHRLALEYLCESKFTISEVAYLVGFSEPAAFSRAFKRWTGLSPRDFRKSREQ
jgi:AraC-like DNA-binding protein